MLIVTEQLNRHKNGNQTITKGNHIVYYNNKQIINNKIGANCNLRKGFLQGKNTPLELLLISLKTKVVSKDKSKQLPNEKIKSSS